MLSDFDTVSVRILVENAVVQDLSDPNQGICKVNLDFNHFQTTDLQMYLTSPNGDQVFLIGPANSPGIILPLITTEHDICFLPPDSSVTPDPWMNMSGIWSNFDWIVPPTGDYSGTYYPSGGSLADFSIGSVEGIWELTIIDEFVNDEGILNSFEIEFCDDSLSCLNCESMAGSFDLEALILCQGSLFDTDEYFETLQEDTIAYAELFVIFEDESLLELSETPAFELLDTGKYQVYGLSVLRSQLNEFITDFLPLQKTTFLADINSEGGQYCVDISPRLCLEVEMAGVPVVVTDSVVICPGDFFLVGMDSVDEEGLYQLPLRNCDTIEQVQILVNPLQAAVVEDSVVLSCEGSMAMLDASPSTLEGNSSIAWFDPDMNMIGDQASITVTEVGTYMLVVSNEFCSDSTEVFITSPSTPEFIISTDIGVLNCTNGPAFVSVASSEAISEVQWSGPNFSMEPDPRAISAFAAGTYTALVTFNNGCQSTDSIVIAEDTALPAIGLLTDSLSCAKSEAFLRVVSSDDNLDYAWFDDSGVLLSDREDLTVNEGGPYSVRITASNTCDTLISFEVSNDTTALSVSGIPSDLSLTCQISSITVNPQFDQSLSSGVFWSNQNGNIVSTSPDIALSGPGLFTFQLFSENGCETTRQVEVVLDTMTPAVTVLSDTLTCLVDPVILSAMPNNPSFIYSWSGSGITMAQGGEYEVNEAGTYELSATDPSNGCMSSVVVEVVEDKSLPSFIVSLSNDLSCEQPSAQLIADTEEGARVFWTDLDGIISETRTFEAFDGGEYVYRIVGRNGCEIGGALEVEDNSDAPPINLSNPYVISCEVPSQVLEVNTTGVQEVSWIFSDGTVDNNPQITIIDDNIDMVSIVGDNGCINVSDVVVMLDTTAPDITIESDTLTCELTSSAFELMGTQADYVYNWYGSNTEVDGSNELNPSYSMSGTYSVMIIDTSNGCTSDFSHIVETNIDPPTVDIIGDTVLTCTDRETSLLAQGDQIEEFMWILPDATEVISDSIRIAAPGIYTFFATSSNGCERVVPISITEDEDVPSISIPSELMINCEQRELVLSQEDSTNTATVIWTFADGSQQNTNTIVIEDDGLVGIQVIGANGCESSRTLSVAVDTLMPSVLLNNAPTFICETGGQLLELDSASHLDSFVYGWTLNGMSVGNDQASLLANESGLYEIEVTNGNNQCSNRTSISLEFSPSPLQLANFDVVDESCLGENDGMIALLDVEGGVGDAQLFIDDQLISGNSDIRAPGNYMISVVDEAGCSLDTTISILQGADITVDIGTDRMVFFGEQVSIDAFISDVSDVVGINWILNGAIISNDSSSIVFNPVTDTEVSIQVETSAGCTRTDMLNIVVEINTSNLSLYVPNAINPESPFGNNAIQVLLPPGTRSLDYFLIFDRWGNRMVDLNDVFSDTEILVWDGRFNNELVSSGVYVFVYQLTSVNNEVSRGAGDITVIR